MQIIRKTMQIIRKTKSKKTFGKWGRHIIHVLPSYGGLGGRAQRLPPMAFGQTLEQKSKKKNFLGIDKWIVEEENSSRHPQGDRKVVGHMHC